MTVLTANAALELVRHTEAVGAPRDQVLNLCGRGWIPFPKQWHFHAAARECDRPDGPVKVGFGGARGPGKSASTFAQITLDDCQRVDGLKCLFVRQTQKAAREAFDDLRLRILRYTRHEHKNGILHFRNGSRVILGGFQNDKDIDKFLGIEYDLIAIEEDTQLSYSKKERLLTCLRTSKRNWRPRSYHTTNPGGIDHVGFKKEFIEPFRKAKETRTRFVPAVAQDNPALNPEYLTTLQGLTGWLRQAWLEGDWDVAAGQYFSTWRHDVHVIEPFPIPKHWPVWAAMDYGFTHPTVATLVTKFDGTYYVIAEYGKSKTLPATHIEGIRSQFRTVGVELDRLQGFSAGADVFQMRGDAHGQTIADQYRDLGLDLQPAVMDRVAGATGILKLLGDREHGIEPKLKVFSTCVNLIEQIPSMVHDPNHPEDVLKVDVDESGNGGDDGYDSLRYALSSEGGVGVYV